MTIGETTEPREEAFLVGPHLVTPARNRLGRGAAACSLQPKVMRLLCTLAASPGRTFSRTELIEIVWEGTIVSNAAIDRAVCNLRKALGDSARRPVFVETIQKRGFRLMVPVECAQASPPRSFVSPADDGFRWRALRRKAVDGRLVAAALGIGALTTIAAPVQRDGPDHQEDAVSGRNVAPIALAVSIERLFDAHAAPQ